MKAQRDPVFKEGYDGPQTAHQITPLEQEAFRAKGQFLQRRIHDAMLCLSSWDDHHLGGGSGWPAYVHEWSDLVGQEEVRQVTRAARFQPTSQQHSDALRTLQLLDGLRPIYQKVAFLRAIGEFYGGMSFAAIGERFGRTEAWAMRTYEVVLIVASRRAGVLSAAPRGHAVLVASVHAGGHRTFLTTARDVEGQLRVLKANNALAIEEAFALWVAGKPVAQRLAKHARKHLIGQVTHGSWHLVSPDSMCDLLVEEARRIAAPFEIEELKATGPSGPRLKLIRDSLLEGTAAEEWLADQAAGDHAEDPQM